MIRVRLHNSGAITCHHKPHWLLRLFGARLLDYEVEHSGTTWVNADTGAPVSTKAVEAIERALTKRAVLKRLESRLVGR